jgi:hypothetical protein
LRAVRAVPPRRAVPGLPELGRDFVTARYPLSDAAAALRIAVTDRRQLRVVIEPQTGSGPAHGAPLAILSCDNLVHNGSLTRRLVTEFIAALPRGARDELLPWVTESIAFRSSMVDRIAPATNDAHAPAGRRAALYSPRTSLILSC